LLNRHKVSWLSLILESQIDKQDRQAIPRAYAPLRVLVAALDDDGKQRCDPPSPTEGPAELVWLARHAVDGPAGLVAAVHTGGPSVPRSADNQFIRFTRHSPDIQIGFAAAQLLQGRNRPTQHMKTQL
jgi:hypothetical protein